MSLPGFDELRPPLSEAAAVLEADRCLECGGPHEPAPCQVACPSGIDVPAFIAALARGDAADAARTIYAENVLGGTCARVCPVEVLCQAQCVLEHEGRKPIEIAALQRYATDWGLAHGTALRDASAWNGFRVAVVGAGPAGLACAGELAASGYDVTVYEGRPAVGGLARYAIAPYRIVTEPLDDEARLLEELGVELNLGTPIDSPETLAGIVSDADALVLCIGLGEDTRAGIPGEELPGVYESLPFIGALKAGRPLPVGRRVAVIGGGNTAVDVAREALRLGAETVTMLYRRTEAEMPAYSHEVVEAREEGIRFEWLTIPARFVGFTALSGVECRRAELGEPDASGRRRPVEIPGSEFLLEVDTAITAIGQRRWTELPEWLGLGELKVDPATGRTSDPKIFAAGDAVNGGDTVVEAVREGKLAAASVDAMLGGSR
jgi:glutamate synthase (NADPH/NADH) small chain